MTRHDYKAAREFLEKKSLHLMDHENKAHAPVGWPAESYEEFSVGDRIFYIIRTNVFRKIIGGFVDGENISGVLVEASASEPHLFGTGNADDVIEAVYNIHPWGNLVDFAELLRSENFCYIIENVNGIIDNKILRLDLFRMLQDKGNGEYGFTGGLFHAFKHFSVNGRPLSTAKQIHDIPSADYLIGYIANAFFHGDLIQESQTDYIVQVPYEEAYGIIFVFYREINSDVYFLKTVRQGKPRANSKVTH